jgi:hypothetical protein
MLSRRSLFEGTTCAVALLSSGISTAQAAEPPGSFLPWQIWNEPSVRGTPLALVSAAILAANAHNFQPWLFHVEETRIDVFADVTRDIGKFDPLLREMFLGLGCAIENAVCAAGVNGYDVSVETPAGELATIKQRIAPVPAATLHLTKREAVASGELYRAIPLRHTNRNAYDIARLPPKEWHNAVSAQFVNDAVRLFLFDDAAQINALNTCTLEATIQTVADTPDMGAAGQQWLAQTREQTAATPLNGIIATRDRYECAAVIAAGRAWQRLHLLSTAHGVDMQPVNQAVELADRESREAFASDWDERLAAFTGGDWKAVLVFRAGYARVPAQISPRRALKDVLLS